jgi:hypothetical protein
LKAQKFDGLARSLSSRASRRQITLFLAVFAGVGIRVPPVIAADETPSAVPCDAGWTYCPEGGCVDLQSDPYHCGACGNPCASELASVVCRGGECVRENCPPGLTHCTDIDICRDLTHDPDHCGACGFACASGVCIGGFCSPSDESSCSEGAGCSGCAPGQTECNGVCADTCCDPLNCGACGVACPNGLTCFEGVCDCPSGLCCPQSEVLCDGSCVATCCDNDHCGACGNACPAGQTCFEGACGCPKGYCPPVKLPNTGTGAGAISSETWARAAVAMASLAAAVRFRARPNGNDLAATSLQAESNQETR